MITVKCILQSGISVEGKCEDDEYEAVYDQWASGRGFMSFSNCEIKTCDVSAIVWE